MANNNLSDPLDGLRKAMADLETRFDEMSKAIFGTDAFAKGANTASDLGAKVQQNVSEQMRRNLSFFNMPSREDVTALGERMMAIDDRLARIEDKLDKLAPAPAKKTASGPPRTRKAPAKKPARKSGGKTKKSSSKKPA